MSNRLNVAHAATRREPHEWMPARRPVRNLATSALNWLRSVADRHEVPAMMRRDLGLPHAATAGIAFNCEIERSRLRL